MARGLWKGAISFGLVNVPVELFSAEKRAGELALTMLDKRDLAPVGYKRYNKSTGEDVPWAEIVKGYEHDDGKGETQEITEPEKGEPAPARAGVIDLMAPLKKSVEKKHDRPRRARAAPRGKRRAAQEKAA